jgi:hypothetical protein
MMLLVGSSWYSSVVISHLIQQRPSRAKVYDVGRLPLIPVQSSSGGYYASLQSTKVPNLNVVTSDKALSHHASKRSQKAGSFLLGNASLMRELDD